MKMKTVILALLGILMLTGCEEVYVQRSHRRAYVGHPYYSDDYYYRGDPYYRRPYYGRSYAPRYYDRPRSRVIIGY